MNDKVKVLHSAQGAGNAVMALGVAEGFFNAVGFDVTMQEVARTGLAVAGLMAGEAQFAVSGSVPVLNAAREGLDPVIVMSIEAQNVFGVIGARGIDAPDKLRGQVIAITGRREQDDLMMRRALLEWGIDPDRDVMLEVKGSRGRCYDAVLAGEASAMTATIPQPILARAMGLPVLKDYAPTHEPFQLGAIVTTRRFINDHAAMVQRFLAAQRQALELYCRDFEVALPHLQARSKLDDVAVLRETHRLFAAEADRFVPDPAALRAVVRTIEAVYGDQLDVNVDRIVEPRFAQALLV